jgi:hypothetical protein
MSSFSSRTSTVGQSRDTVPSRFNVHFDLVITKSEEAEQGGADGHHHQRGLPPQGHRRSDNLVALFLQDFNVPFDLVITKSEEAE